MVRNKYSVSLAKAVADDSAINLRGEIRANPDGPGLLMSVKGVLATFGVSNHSRFKTSMTDPKSELNQVLAADGIDGEYIYTHGIPDVAVGLIALYYATSQRRVSAETRAIALRLTKSFNAVGARVYLSQLSGIPIPGLNSSGYDPNPSAHQHGSQLVVGDVEDLVNDHVEAIKASIKQSEKSTATIHAIRGYTGDAVRRIENSLAAGKMTVLDFLDEVTNGMAIDVPNLIALRVPRSFTPVFQDISTNYHLLLGLLDEYFYETVSLGHDWWLAEEGIPKSRCNELVTSRSNHWCIAPTWSNPKAKPHNRKLTAVNFNRLRTYDRRQVRYALGALTSKEYDRATFFAKFSEVYDQPKIDFIYTGNEASESLDAIYQNLRQLERDLTTAGVQANDFRNAAQNAAEELTTGLDEIIGPDRQLTGSSSYNSAPKQINSSQNRAISDYQRGRNDKAREMSNAQRSLAEWKAPAGEVSF